MRFDKIDLLFMAGVVDVIVMFLCAMYLAASVLGYQRPADMFWAGLGVMFTGVIFKVILDKL
jgi:hypothetical protein